MATLASPFETDAPRKRFSRQDSRRIAKSAQRLRRALAYDVKGDLVTRTASLQSPALSLVWDFDNKLKGADTNGTPASLEVTYEYDALGRRGARSGQGGNVVYFQAGQQTIADYPRGGAPASATYRYVYGSYVDEPLLRETVSGSVRHFFHRNQQYSVTALTDSAGNTAERYAYTAYGALTVFNSSGIPQATSPLNNRYTYTGREWDDSTKLYHFRARWYDAAAGRFVGRDPLGFVDGMGLYGGYFGISRVDPYGKSIRNQNDEILDWFFPQMEDNAANTKVVCLGFGGSIYAKGGGGLIINYCFDSCGNSAIIGIPNLGIGVGASLGGGATIMPGKCIDDFYHCKPGWNAQGSIGCVTGGLQGGFESPVPQGGGIGLPGGGVTIGPEPGVQTGDLVPPGKPQDNDKKGWGVQGAISVSVPVVLSRSQPRVRCPCPPRHPPPACNSGSKPSPHFQCHMICMDRTRGPGLAYEDCMDECFDRWQNSDMLPYNDHYWH